MTDVRLGEINRLLAKPPVLGLALDPTLGLYVVARLAARHGIEIRLVRGVPGMTVRVTIPRDKLEVATRPQDEGPALDDHGAALGESRHVTLARDNGAVVTAERRRVHQRTPSAHDREATNDRQSSAPPLRPVGPIYPVSDAEYSTPGSPLPLQLVSNRLSVANPSPPQRETTAPPAVRPAAVPEPRPQTSAGLPARTPGASFNESPVHSPTSVRSEMSPDGIKDALSAFQGAREIADHDRPGPDSGPNGRHADPSTNAKPEDGTQ
jgi:hypothetical protein